MRNKLFSLKEAVGFVNNGSTLGLTSTYLENAPMAFLRELVRCGIKNLNVVTLPGGGLCIDFLIGAGAVAEYETCFCSLGDYGQAPNFQRALSFHSIKLKDNTWGVMYSMVQAGSMGLPFISVRGLLGSDILKYRVDLQVIENPFIPGEEVVIAKPIRPDISLLHGLKADCLGNTLTPGLRDDLMIARASKLVIVTVEEISDQELTPRDAGDETFLPAMDVDGVVCLPFGAHPCACGSRYSIDEAHLKEYLEASGEEKTFRSYLEKYVHSVSKHEEYLKQVGMTIG